MNIKIRHNYLFFKVLIFSGLLLLLLAPDRCTIIDDSDQDSIPDRNDNCPNTPNPEQENSDRDSFGDACDNCPFVRNEDQLDTNKNGVGDVCDYVPLDYNGTFQGNLMIDFDGLEEHYNLQLILVHDKKTGALTGQDYWDDIYSDGTGKGDGYNFRFTTVFDSGFGLRSETIYKSEEVISQDKEYVDAIRGTVQYSLIDEVNGKRTYQGNFDVKEKRLSQ